MESFLTSLSSTINHPKVLHAPIPVSGLNCNIIRIRGVEYSREFDPIDKWGVKTNIEY